MNIVNPDGWPRPSGYANGVVAEGRVVTIAGQIGWNPVTMQFESDDFVEQVSTALRNVVTVLRAAGGRAEHVVRLTWYVTSRDSYVDNLAEIGAVYRKDFGSHYPAMSVVVVAGLLEQRAQVEIEATAVLPR